MDDPRFRQRADRLPPHHPLLPVQLVLRAPSSQPPLPHRFGVFINNFQHLVVASDTVILIVPAQLALQGLVLFHDVQVSVDSAPLVQSTQEPAQPFPLRLAFDSPSPVPGFIPVVVEPKERERPTSFPSSSTPTCSHIPISLRIAPSLTRRCRIARRCVGSIVSKNLAMSASIIQLMPSFRHWSRR